MLAVKAHVVRRTASMCGGEHGMLDLDEEDVGAGAVDTTQEGSDDRDPEVVRALRECLLVPGAVGEQSGGKATIYACTQSSVQAESRSKSHDEHRQSKWCSRVLDSGCAGP
ncbi:hypothetical protein PHYPSEUDO_004223 [Phytophthora pseudosyringae]|uniref:Uncharacterized protein n=1 Tax=Phytophthora pseudosyringae TaxID=221518 RepID=A0A8T1VNR8_9STRA|nr:hypothetical protein PHYPSEUDO_004223 [Phytophthora pseudosyringae]